MITLGTAVTIDYNEEVDKIYASGSFFGFYKIISRPETPVTLISEPLSWDSRQTGRTSTGYWILILL